MAAASSKPARNLNGTGTFFYFPFNWIRKFHLFAPEGASETTCFGLKTLDVVVFFLLYLDKVPNKNNKCGIQEYVFFSKLSAKNKKN